MLASPELINGRKLIALKIMSLLGGYAYTASQPRFIAMLGLREMKMIFRSWLSKYLAETFATSGILGGQMGDFQLAFRYGNLASTIAAKFPSWYHTPRSLLAVHFFLWHLRKAAHESIEPLLMAYRFSIEIRDIRNAALSFSSYIVCYLACRLLPLGPIVQDTKQFRIELSDHSQDLMYLLTSIAYQTLLNLTDGGNVGNPLKITGTAIDEEIILHDATDNNSSIVAHNIYL